jgi:hypothetical protein
MPEPNFIIKMKQKSLAEERYCLLNSVNDLITKHIKSVVSYTSTNATHHAQLEITVYISKGGLFSAPQEERCQPLRPIWIGCCDTNCFCSKIIRRKDDMRTSKGSVSQLHCAV